MIMAIEYIMFKNNDNNYSTISIAIGEIIAGANCVYSYKCQVRMQKNIQYDHSTAAVQLVTTTL